MNRIAFFLLAATLGGRALAEPEPKLLEPLPALLAPAPTAGALAINKEKGWEISFCPDNTCEVIHAPAGTPEEKVGDFAFLYLYYASGYVYLKDFYLHHGRPYVSAALTRNAGSCNQPEEFARAACVMTSLAKRYHFRVGTRTYDEGARADNFEEPAALLTEARIKSTKAWQQDQWHKN